MWENVRNKIDGNAIMCGVFGVLAFYGGSMSRQWQEEKQDASFTPILERKMSNARQVQQNEYLVEGIENSNSGRKLSTEELFSAFERAHPKLKVLGILPTKKLESFLPELKYEPGSLVFLTSPRN